MIIRNGSVEMRYDDVIEHKTFERKSYVNFGKLKKNCKKNIIMDENVSKQSFSVK